MNAAWARLQAAAQEKVQITGEKPSLVLFLLLISFALLKDMTDIAFGAIPVVGIVLSFIVGVCVALIIFLLMLIFDRSCGTGSMMVVKMMVRRAAVFLLAIFADSLPLVSFLPLMTISVIVLYILAHYFWKQRLKAAESAEATASRAAGRTPALALAS